MRRYVWDILDDVREQSGSLHKFILGTGDALAKETPLENLHAVTQAVREYRG